MDLYCTVSYNTPKGRKRTFTHTSPKLNDRPEWLVYYTLRDHTNSMLQKVAVRKLREDILHDRVTSPHVIHVKQGEATIEVTVIWYMAKSSISLAPILV